LIYFSENKIVNKTIQVMGTKRWWCKIWLQEI